MKKLLTILFLSLFLISAVSAMQWDNVKVDNGWKKELKEDFQTDKVDLKYNKLWDKYEPITIRNARDFPILNKKLFEGALTSHSEVCEYDYCYSIMEVYTSGDDALIDDIQFLTEQEDGSWIEQDVRDYKFLVNTGNTQIEVEDYEYQCEDIGLSPNGTMMQSCSNVLTGTHLEDAPEWTEFQMGETFEEGNYKIKLEAHKKPSRTVDWIIKTNGEWIGEWAVWGSTTLTTDLVTYYSFEDTSDVHSGTHNLTNSGTANTSGIIGSARDYGDGEDDYMYTSDHVDFTVSAYTVSAWLYPDSQSGDDAIFNQWGASPAWITQISSGSLSMANYGGTTSTLTCGGGGIENGQWSHVVFIYDGGTTGTNGHIYLNGSLLCEGTISQTPDDSSNNPTIGIEAGTTTSPVDMRIDELGFWNRGLTSEEAISLYNSGSGLSYPFTQGNVSLNSPSDASISDTSNVQFNATATVTGGAYLTNMSLWTNETGSWVRYNTSTIGGSSAGVVAGGTVFYKFDESSGTTADDYLETYDGTISGSASAGATGVFGNAVDIDGGGYVTTQNINADGDWSVSTWVKLESLSDTDYIWADDEHIFFGIEPDGAFRCGIDDGISPRYTKTSAGTITVGEWIHIACTRDRTPGDIKIYINGVENVTSSQPYDAYNRGGTPNIGCYYSLGECMDGQVDDFGLWESVLTPSEIQEIYVGQGTESTQTWNRTITDGIIWNVQACDSDGDCGFSTSNFSLSIDTAAPTVDILYPTGNPSFTNGENVSLNYSITDSNIDTCWYQYNGVNTTTPCSSNSSFIYSSGVNTIDLFANDTVGNSGSDTSTWTSLYTINSESHNATTFETASETFSINITANSSLTAVVLNYNGTEYATTQSGNVWSKTIDIPLNKLQNNSYKYTLTYGGSNYDSDTYYQNVSETVWTLCNSTYTDDFLNLSFQDENDFSSINASIPTSTWLYYLGSGLVNKTYSYLNTSNNFNYTFCSSVGTRTLYVDPVVQYKQGTDYPQRTWDAAVQSYNQTVTNKILYLLSSIDGVYQTFQLQSQSGSVIEGVNVIGTREIGGSDTQVAQGDTDGSGSVTFWVNPDFSHDWVFSKTGYDDYELTYTPIGGTKTIVLGGGASPAVIDDLTKGISFSTRPASDYLTKDTFYNFNYTISTSYWTLDSWGFTLKYQNGTEIGTQTSTNQGGGTVSLNANTTNQTRVIMNYFYEINDTYTNFTRTWKVYEENDYSLTHLFARMNTYIDADLLGIQSDDGGQFGKALISFVIILLVSGGLVMRYGINSEATIMGMLAGLILFLNQIGFLPNLSIFENAILSFGDLLVFITLIIAVSFLIKEERA